MTKMKRATILLAAATLIPACGSDGVFSETATSTTGSGSGASGPNGSGGESAGVGGGASTTGQGGAATTTGAGGGNPVMAPDPEMVGPYTTAVVDDTVTVPATGSEVDIHCVYPTAGPDAGPYPVVVLGHGFQIPPSQYDSYLDHLASFGYVALSVDFPTSFVFPNHAENAQELAYGIDWAAAHATLGPVADAMNAGSTGHSLGGKLAVQVASFDMRIQAVIALDPVDGSMNCSPTNCPDASNMLPFGIPTGFIGETVDASGGFQNCAPAADNFETFYASAGAPSLSVEVVGANHFSFIDDLQACGFTCTICNEATAMQDDVRLLSRATMVAFFERYLRGDTRYDVYLTGAEAQTRYVDTGLAIIQSK